MFGNIYIKQKQQLQQFSSILSNFLEITVFILIGILIDIPTNWVFFVKSGLLFLIYLLVRFISIGLTFRKKEFNLREKLFMALNASKGIAVAVVATLLLSYSLAVGNKQILFTSLPGSQEILNYTLIFVLYSIIVSTISIKFSKYFIKRKVAHAEEIEIIKEKRKVNNPKIRTSEKQKKMKKQRIKKLQKKIKKIRKK